MNRFVLIDYENVQREAMSALVEEHFNVIVLRCANQAKVSFEVASALYSRRVIEPVTSIFQDGLSHLHLPHCLLHWVACECIYVFFILLEKILVD